MKVKVGDRFMTEQNWPYTDGNKKGIHHVKRIVEVTEVFKTRVEYKTVEILEETGRPSFTNDPIENGGGFALFCLTMNPPRFVKVERHAN